MAYRLATYFAVDGDESEALHWLRRAIYLGNENYPWFTKNPAWKNLVGHSDFERILEDLKKSYRRNQKNWKRLLAQLPPNRFVSGNVTVQVPGSGMTPRRSQRLLHDLLLRDLQVHVSGTVLAPESRDRCECRHPPA